MEEQPGCQASLAAYACSWTLHVSKSVFHTSCFPYAGLRSMYCVRKHKIKSSGAILKLSY